MLVDQFIRCQLPQCLVVNATSEAATVTTARPLSFPFARLSPKSLTCRLSAANSNRSRPSPDTCTRSWQARRRPTRHRRIGKYLRWAGVDRSCSRTPIPRSLLVSIGITRLYSGIYDVSRFGTGSSNTSQPAVEAFRIQSPPNASVTGEWERMPVVRRRSRSTWPRYKTQTRSMRSWSMSSHRPKPSPSQRHNARERAQRGPHITDGDDAPLGCWVVGQFRASCQNCRKCCRRFDLGP